MNKTDNRGLYPEEIKALLNAPYKFMKGTSSNVVRKASEDALLLKLLYDTWARVNELVNVKVGHIDFSNRMMELRVTKAKTRRIDNGEYESEAVKRTVDFSDESKFMILRHLDGRKTGYLFPGREGTYTHKTTRAVRDMIYKYAGRLGIQKEIGKDKNGHPKYLIHPHSLREAGECYAIIHGMKEDTAAKRAGHTVDVQKRHYRKYDAVRARIEMDLSREQLGRNLGL